MANPIHCDSGDGNLAYLLITNLGNGDTSGVCVECVPAWCEAMLDLYRQAAQEMAATQPTAEAPGAGEGEAAQDPPSPKRRRSGRRSGSHDPRPAHAYDGEPSPEDLAAAPEALTAPESPFADVAPDE